MRLSRALGLFSLALALAEMAAPRRVERLTGLRGKRGLVRLFGLREFGTGAALLASRRPGPWLWARVAGDVLDAAVLGRRAGRSGPGRGRALASVATVAGIGLVDAWAARRARR